MEADQDQSHKALAQYKQAIKLKATMLMPGSIWQIFTMPEMILRKR